MYIGSSKKINLHLLISLADFAYPLVSRGKAGYTVRIKDSYPENSMRSFLPALFLSLTLLVTPSLAKDPVFVTNIDFAPYSMITQGEPAGIDVDVLAEAARRAGLTLDIQFKPWDEAVAMVQKGECDGAFSMFHSPEREQFAMFMDEAPVHYSDYVLFTTVGNKFAFNTYADLSGKVIGRVSGTDLGPDFAKAHANKDITVKEYPDLAASLRGLLQGEIDAYAGNIDVTYYRLKSMGMTSSIVYLPKKLVELKPAYLVVSRASKLADKEGLIQALERALDQMRKDGTYNKLARKYLLRY